MSNPEIVSNAEQGLPDAYIVGQELNWNAPWVDVYLRVELPFWLMVNNAEIEIELECHRFPLTLRDDYFELHSGATVCYQGPFRHLDELGDDIQQFRKDNPDF